MIYSTNSFFPLWHKFQGEEGRGVRLGDKSMHFSPNNRLQNPLKTEFG